VSSAGATRLGPKTAGGTFLLLGGRRALLLPDGSLRGEAAPTPEPIVELAEVPLAAGARALVGRGAHEVYRFDDPLGAPVLLARSEAPLARLGAGPGLVALWADASPSPRFVDATSGAKTEFPNLPVLPMTALAFRSAREGAAVFEGVGLAVTTDGGATFRPVTSGTPGEALRVTGLRLHGGGPSPSLRAYVHVDGREAEVDVAAARLGAFVEPVVPAGEPATARWVQATGRDPLEAAVASGAAAGEGVAIVASHGLLARVDTLEGRVLELAEIARGGAGNECTVARAGVEILVACALSPDVEGDLYDPFGVFAVETGRALAVKRPLLARAGEAELRTSPSGGAMLLAPCTADEEGAACVRQPGGRWITFHSDVDLRERGAGPLGDGRVALLRGLFEGDDAEATAAAAEHARPAGFPSPYAVAIDAHGAESVLGEARWSGRVSGPLRVSSPLREDASGVLRFALVNDEGAFALAIDREGLSPPPTRADRARFVLLAGDEGVALGEDGALATTDAGRSFEAIALPEAARAALADLAREVDVSGDLALSDVGVALGGLLRLGWGAGGAPPPAPPPPTLPRAGVTALAAEPAPPPAGAPLTLTCTRGAATKALAFAMRARDAREALATKGKPPAGQRRQSSLVAGARAIDAAASLEEEGPDRGGAAPARWRLRWHDPLEVGGGVHTWSGRAPVGASFGAVLRAASASAGRALFTVRAAGKFLLVRVEPGGSSEIVEVPYELLPGADVAFERARDGAIAWAHEGAIVVWARGDRPAVATSIATRTSRAIGAPEGAGLPLILGGQESSFLRTLPLFTRPGPAPREPLALPLDGWSALRPLRRELASLPACAAGAPGARVELGRSGFEVVLDGAARRASAGLYGVRVAPGGACVESIAAVLAPGSDKDALAFVRADLAARKAEGSAAADGRAARLACALAPSR
jgi:hypothetical protein